MAIDQDGELWFLAGFQNYVGNAGLPLGNYRDNHSFSSPTKTQHMAKNGTRATSIQVTSQFAFVATEDV